MKREKGERKRKREMKEGRKAGRNSDLEWKDIFRTGAI